MKKYRFNRAGVAFLIAAMVFMNLVAPSARVMAADHLEATIAIEDSSADLGDSFIFLSPVDNTRVVLAMTVAGFLPPAQMLNYGFFSPQILYRFEIETTGDATPDRFIDITFSEQTARNVGQTATIYPNGIGVKSTRFTAPATAGNFTAAGAPFVVTTNPSNNISFFAGITDDPFYFDIPAFGRFVASVTAGTPDPTRFNRSRDAFAGYNGHTIALELPVSALQGSAGNIIGLNAVTLRSRRTGNFVQIDRAGVPAVNTALIPFPRKNEFNSASTMDDAAGRFANSIVATLNLFGTSPANINILASVAVANGDFLRLNTSTPNLSQGFGERLSSPGYTGFPNGRRLGDDTIDVLLFFISNGGLTTGDNVMSNEVPLTNTFPFFGRPHQPRENPTVDDLTRN